MALSACGRISCQTLQKGRGKPVQIFRRRRDRYGFDTPGNRLLGMVLSVFFGCRCRIPEEIAGLDEPVVFVSNHYEIFGPLAMVTSLPLKYRLWSHSIILEPTRHIDHMAPDCLRAIPVLTLRGARRLLERITPIWERAFRRFDPIPVYKKDLGRQRASIRRTVEVMQQGDHIVLFPETGLPHYSDGGVTEFYRSFALVGEYYRRATGKKAAFCPVYIDKKRRRIDFGTVVRYGEADAQTECDRLSDALRSQILAMAEKAHPGITAGV